MHLGVHPNFTVYVMDTFPGISPAHYTNMSYIVCSEHKSPTSLSSVSRSEWKLTLCGRITYRHCRKPKLPNFLYSSNRLFGGEAVDAGNATPTFCFSVLAISKLTTLTVESLWTAPTETAIHYILAIDEAS